MSVTLVAPALEPVRPPQRPTVEPAVEHPVEPPDEQPVIEDSLAPQVQPEPPAPVQQPKPRPRPKPKPKPKPVHKPVAKVEPKELAPPPSVVSIPQNTPIRSAPASPTAPAVAKVSSGPKAVSRPDPAYPERARALGIEGTVKIRFDVNDDGLLENVQVISASPRNVFERDVRQITRRWRYESGKPGKNIVVTIQFKLTGVSSATQ